MTEQPTPTEHPTPDQGGGAASLPREAVPVAESAAVPPTDDSPIPTGEPALPPVESAALPPVEEAALPPSGAAAALAAGHPSTGEPVAEEAATEPVAEEPSTEPSAVDEARPDASSSDAPASEAVQNEPAAGEVTQAEAAPSAESEATPSAESEAPSEQPAAATTVAAAAPSPRPTPKPLPRPVPRPKGPAAARPAAATPPAPPVDPHDAAEAAAWGRVDDDGTVWVREAAGERSVGQYTGADREEALGFYVRRFLDLQAQVALFEARLPQLGAKEIEQTLQTLDEALKEPAAVGDIDALRARLEALRTTADERRQEAAAQRDAARAKALAERTSIVEQAEEIAAQDPGRTQWKQSGERLRELLDQWKSAQRTGPRLDRSAEDSLWKRFSHARTAFDRHRRQYFSELDAAQGAVKAAKEKLIARAEELATSTDWARTATTYRQLMDEWKAAGRASRKDDDALWARFRAAQQRFFDARSAQNAEVDAEYSENLKVKLAILEEAEALLPVTDVKAARAALRPLQDRWDEAGKVPRADVQRVEGRMRAVEQAVREAEEAAWKRSNPETKARAEGAAAQLESAIEQLEAQLEEARAGGDARAVAEAEQALEARRAWLDQIQRTAQG